jgi:hypothetical protein
MSSAVAPPTPAHHSRLWHVTTIVLVVFICLAVVFGAVHLYARYAQTLDPVPTRQHTVEKSTQPEKPKTPKATSSEKPGAGGTASSEKAGTTSSGDSADTSEKVGGDKTHAKATTTPGL